METDSDMAVGICASFPQTTKAAFSWAMFRMQVSVGGVSREGLVPRDGSSGGFTSSHCLGL